MFLARSCRIQDELQAARTGVDARVAAVIGEKAELAQRLTEAEAKVAQLSRANDELLASMRSVLGETHHELVGMRGDQYKALMDYLGRDKQLAATQLELLTSEWSEVERGV